MTVTAPAIAAPEATRSRPADVGFERAPVVPFSPAKNRGKSARILLAEDNSVNQFLMTRLLEKQNHSVHLVVTGKQAVEALAQLAHYYERRGYYEQARQAAADAVSAWREVVWPRHGLR